jgi:competence protein ComEA
MKPHHVLYGALIAAAACVASAAVALATIGDGTRARVVAPRHRIDLATAPAAELALLPEVGPSLAARIAADRAVRGPFESVDALARVPGVGQTTLAALREDARVGAGGTE